MKYIPFFILSTFTINLLAQSVQLPPESVIEKNHVKTISRYFNNDSIKNELSEVWKFDINGKLISNQLFDNDDTTLSIDLYFYKHNILIENWKIGKCDTIKITYFYDNQNRIVKETTIGKFNPFNGKSNGFKNTISYTYLSDTVVIKKFEGNALTARGSGMDSIIYNKDKNIRLIFNRENGLKIVYSYNNKKQITAQVITYISESDLILHYSKYFYENGQLIYEIMGHSIDGSKEKNNEQKYFYTNDRNGLLVKVQRPLTFDTYEYGYYK